MRDGMPDLRPVDTASWASAPSGRHSCVGSHMRSGRGSADPRTGVKAPMAPEPSACARACMHGVWS